MLRQIKMRTLFIYMFITLLSFGLVVNEASAKRFGGGRSFGVQRSQSSLFSSRAAPNAKSFGRQPNTRKWGGLLGGLLLGGLLTSLFMGHGFGTGLLTWLILGGLVLFLMNLFRRKMQPGFQTASPYASKEDPFKKAASFFTNQNGPMSSTTYPIGFESEKFLREAKVTFLRLQTAYDQKNKQDLRNFTAPEVFAEIEMQLNERGNELNVTEVLNLNAELLDVSKQVDSFIASVKFTGTVKENSETVSLDEIWHFRQFAGNDQWIVGGIQQQVIQP